MARRTRKWPPVGKWLRAARRSAGLSLSALASRTTVSVSSLARFESDRAVPSFGDVCIIAQQLGWPLLYFATGRERAGDDVRAVAAQLRFWGLRELRLPESVLFGEVRPFEELLAEVAAGSVNLRLVEALPALLLRNRFEPAELVLNADSRGSLRRLGWLADVATKVSEQLPPSYSQPDARRKLDAVMRAAKRQLGSVSEAAETDYLGPVTASGSRASRERLRTSSPPLTRRWKIACDLTLEQFIERARSLLSGV